MSNGMALDTLWVQDQDGTPFDRPDKLAKLAFAFENVLTGESEAAYRARKAARLPEPHAASSPCRRAS